MQRPSQHFESSTLPRPALGILLLTILKMLLLRLPIQYLQLYVRYQICNGVSCSHSAPRARLFAFPASCRTLQRSDLLGKNLLMQISCNRTDTGRYCRPRNTTSKNDCQSNRNMLAFPFSTLPFQKPISASFRSIPRLTWFRLEIPDMVCRVAVIILLTCSVLILH